MKRLNILILVVLLINTLGEKLNNCKKIWDMTNNINEHNSPPKNEPFVP